MKATNTQFTKLFGGEQTLAYFGSFVYYFPKFYQLNSILNVLLSDDFFDCLAKDDIGLENEGGGKEGGKF